MYLYCAYSNTYTLELWVFKVFQKEHYRTYILGFSSTFVSAGRRWRKTTWFIKDSCAPALLSALYFHAILIKLMWLQQASDLLCRSWGHRCFLWFLSLFHSVDFHGSQLQSCPMLAVTERKQTGRQILTLVESAFCLRLAKWVCEISEVFASQMPHKAQAVKMNFIKINMTFTASYFIQPIPNLQRQLFVVDYMLF